MSSKKEPANPAVILASASPRRRELLKKLVKRFRTVPSGVDEGVYMGRDPVESALLAAAAKARAVGGKYPASLIIGADTLVTMDGEIFGKPRSREEARAVMEKLSGRRHRVITAVVVYRKDGEKTLTGHESSWVTFKKLTRGEIEAYLESGGYHDKAGGYAIQESEDALVERLEGDYDNVVGLPLRLLGRLLKRFSRPDGSGLV